MTESLASSVAGRLEGQIHKVLSVVLLLSLPELFANSAAQRFFLNDLSAIVLFLLIGTTVAATISSWITGSRVLWFYLHGAATVLSLLAWPLMVEDLALIPEYSKPWIWWTLGIGILSFGLIGNRFVGAAALVGISVAWFFVHTSAVGGSATWTLALQDSLYLFLFGGSIIGLITLVRDGAKRADIANTQFIQSAIEQARIDAVERERQRLDALIHDKVLNTLVLASRSTSEDEQARAAALAAQAIESLKAAVKEAPRNPAVTPIGLFRALKAAALQLAPGIEVKTLSGGAETLPADKAQALTEATLQAIDNARSHSRATKLELTLDSPQPGAVEITLTDNGIGFRSDRIPRDRIGIRTSVLARMRNVGGEALVESEIGRGTKVMLRWPK